MRIELKGKDIRKNYSEDLLLDRGINNVLNFISPKSEFLEEPSKLSNIKLGYDFIKNAIKDDERILLLVDSDCDGYCSAAIIYMYLKDIAPEVSIDVIAHDGKQHGLADIVSRVDINIDNYRYMIVPDAGTNDHEYFDMYSSTKFLVIDHHDSNEEDIQTVGDNYVIINNQLSPEYKNKALPGAGVTWQVCRYMDKVDETDFAKKYVDLVSIAVISDVMNSTTPENRFIIDYGLDNIHNPFIKELLSARADQFSTTSDIIQDKIAWYTTPIINGMCRSGEMDEKLRMFYAFVDGETMVPDTKRGAAEDDLVTRAALSRREAINAKSRQDRRRTKMTELASIKIEELDLLQNKILVLVLDERFLDLPPSLNGVVANQLAQLYSRPVLLGRVNNEGYLKGSGRGVETIDMNGFKSFLQSSNMFEYVSGHENAFGFSIPYSKLDRFLGWANDKLADVDMNEDVYFVDFLRYGSDTDIKHIVYDTDSYKDLWGNFNKPPIIGLKDLKVNAKDILVMGAKKNTVKIIQDGVEYMFFRLSQDEVNEFLMYPELSIDLVGTMSLNTWGGKSTPQIIAQGYEIADEKFAF